MGHGSSLFGGNTNSSAWALRKKVSKQYWDFLGPSVLVVETQLQAPEFLYDCYHWGRNAITL